MLAPVEVGGIYNYPSYGRPVTAYPLVAECVTLSALCAMGWIRKPQQPNVLFTCDAMFSPEVANGRLGHIMLSKAHQHHGQPVQRLQS